MTVTDADLVRAAQGGAAVSLAMLMDRHRAGMYAVAVAMLGASSDSEDVVHDAFLAAATRLGTLCDPGAAGAWLRGIVRNLCLGVASATAVQSQRLVLKMANRTTAAQSMITAEAMKPDRAPNPG